MSEPKTQPFTFRCPTPGCGQTYRARHELVGKLMVCGGCQKKIRIPPAVESNLGPSGTRTSGDVPRAPRREDPPASPRTTEPRKTPPVPRFADETTAPLSFSDDDAGYEIVADNDPLPSPLPLPAPWTAPVARDTSSLVSPPDKKKRKRKKNNLQFLEDIVDSPKLLFIFGGVLALVLIAFGIMFAPLALGMRLIGYLFTGAGFVYALRMAFDESPSCGVIYLLDCTSIYRIYYTVTRWSDMKHAFFAEIFGLLLCVPWVVLTTEQIVDRVPLNLDDFQGIEMDEPDEPDAGADFKPFDDADARIRFESGSDTAWMSVRTFSVSPAHAPVKCSAINFAVRSHCRTASSQSTCMA